MPLIHSKKPAAFSKNVSTEMHAGKPQKQALAIAYSVKRKAEHKKMNHGGEVEGCPLCMDDGGEIEQDPDKAQQVEDSFKGALGFAKGGEVESPDEDHEIHDALGEEMMDAIHTKDKKRMMSAIEAMVLSCMDKE